MLHAFKKVSFKAKGLHRGLGACQCMRCISVTEFIIAAKECFKSL